MLVQKIWAVRLPVPLVQLLGVGCQVANELVIPLIARFSGVAVPTRIVRNVVFDSNLICITLNVDREWSTGQME